MEFFTAREKSIDDRERELDDRESEFDKELEAYQSDAYLGMLIREHIIENYKDIPKDFCLCGKNPSDDWVSTKVNEKLLEALFGLYDKN